MLIPGTLAAGVMTYAWPFAKTEGPLITVAVLYGITSGVYVAIMAQPVVRMGKITEVGMRTGMAFTIMSLGALAGPPISGAILDHTQSFEDVGYYAGECTRSVLYRARAERRGCAGSTVIVSVALMIAARHMLLGKLFGRV